MVLGALGEREPGSHAAMWGMVLPFARAFPGSWAVANLRKAVLPRLHALLRNACYGSGTTSFPAILPLLALLPSVWIPPPSSPMRPLLISSALTPCTGTGWCADGSCCCRR